MPARYAWAQDPQYYHGKEKEVIWFYEDYVYYAFTIYGIKEATYINLPSQRSQTTLQMKIYHPNGFLRMETDTINPRFFV